MAPPIPRRPAPRRRPKWTGQATAPPVHDALPLERAIRYHPQNPLAQPMLAGAFKPGDAIVVGTGAGRMVSHGVEARAA